MLSPEITTTNFAVRCQHLTETYNYSIQTNILSSKLSCKNAKTLQMKQITRCDKAANNHSSTADVNICFKSIKIQRKNGLMKLSGARIITFYYN